MEPDSARISPDILVEEEPPREPHRVALPLVPPAERGVIADVTNDEALFG